MLKRRELKKEFIWRSILSGGRFISPAHSKWELIQRAVNNATAASLYPVGAEIEDTWGEYTAPWVVVNHYANGNMALQWKYATNIPITFDEPESIYYADTNGLAVGTYYIAIGSNFGTGWSTDKNIQFTLTRAMVEGDQLVIELTRNNSLDPTANRTWHVYHAGSTEVLETGTTSNGTDGILLGTIGVENANKPNGQLNAITRVVYGYSRWSQSAIRQYYNSTAHVGQWWTPQNGWDRPPEQAATVDGFMSNFSEDFLQTIKPVEVVTALNTMEGHESDRETTLDKIFLPSLQEMYVEPELSGAEGEDWNYYKALAEEAGITGKFQPRPGFTYAVLKKYNISSPDTANSVWLRSAYLESAINPWYLTYQGRITYYYPYNPYRGCPACIIKKGQ